MEETQIAKLKKGDLFTLKPYDEPKDSQIWVRDEYDRSTKKYIAYRYSDVNDFRTFTGTKTAYSL